MSTHTPGPWTAVQDGNEVDWYIVDEDESVIVFGLSEADARLSAAAPDLLAALQAAEERLIQQQCNGTTFEEVADTLDAVRAAIAKAEGLT